MFSRDADGRCRLPRVALLLLACPGLAGAADDYWGYSYSNIDVTAAASSVYTVNVALYCARLDTMLTRILGIKTNYRAPVHIYALPAAQLRQYLGDTATAYRSSRYELTVVTDNSASNDSDYWGAYYGYTAALLASDRQLRGPDWYLEGVPLVFAMTSYERAHVKLGNVPLGYGLALGQGGALIPMRTFLVLRKHDVVTAGSHNLKMYDAQAWALAHEIFVERWRRAEFDKYLAFLRQGASEADAFAASFNVTYEQLDQEFARTIKQQAYVYTMDIPPVPATSGRSAERLSAAEVRGRLALLTVRLGHGPDAVQLANEALHGEPANQTALRALALAQLERGAYAESLAAADRLEAQGGAWAYSDSGLIFTRLSAAVTDGKAALGVDADTLRRRAKNDYQRALEADSMDLRSRDALTELEAAPVH